MLSFTTIFQIKTQETIQAKRQFGSRKLFPIIKVID